MAKNSRAHRTPGNYRFCSPSARRNFISGGDARRNARQRFIGEARLGVGLENHIGNSAHPGGKQHGSRGVSADAERGDGFVFLEYSRSVQHSGRELEKIFQQRASAFSF